MGADSSSTFYLVFSDVGDPASYRAQAQRGRTDLDGIVEDIGEGRYGNARRVVAFNLAEGWARDVSLYVALACSRSRRIDASGSGDPQSHSAVAGLLDRVH